METLVQAEEEESIMDDSKTASGDYNFAYYEHKYNKLMLEMCDIPSMSKYADAYTAMFEYAYTVNEKQIELAKERKELENKYDESERRLLETGQILIEDAAQIRALNSEMKETYRELDNANENEQEAIEVIDNLRHTMESLQAEIEFKNKMNETEDDENNLNVAKHRLGLERERNKLMKEVAKMNEKFEMALQYQEELEQRTDKTDAQIHTIIEQLEAAALELAKHRRVKEKLEAEVRQVCNDLNMRNDEINSCTARAIRDQHTVVKLDSDFKDQCLRTTNCFSEVTTWNQRLCKMQDELNQLHYSTKTEMRDNAKLELRLRAEDEDQEAMKDEITFRINEKQRVEKKRDGVFKDAINVNNERNKIRADMANTENLIKLEKVHNDEAKREIANKIREKDMINRNLARQHATNSDTLNDIARQKTLRKKIDLKLEGEIDKHHEQIKHIIFLERERDRLKEEGAETIRQIEDYSIESKEQKTLIYEYKKKYAASVNRLRMQQNLYDACCADKSNLELILKTNLARWNKFQNQLSDCNRSVGIMKSEMYYKEQQKLIGIKEIQKMMDVKHDMQTELRTNCNILKELREAIAEHKVITKDLLTQIEGADFCLKEADKKIVMLMNERDMLGAQLVRRNEELALWYDKMDFLKKIIAHGQSKYKNLLDAIALMRKKVLNIRQNKTVFEKKISNMVDFKAEVLALEKDLTHERIVNKVLEEQMGAPMNIHRWSKMEGSDPDLFKMLRRILLLQKRLVRSTRNINDRNLQLKELKTLYKTKRKMVAKQAGPSRDRFNRATRTNDESRIQTEYLRKELTTVGNDTENSRLRWKHTGLELGKERNKLLMEKKLRRRTRVKLRRLEEHGQKIMDDMAKVMSGKTIMEIAAKCSQEFNSP